MFFCTYLEKIDETGDCGEVKTVGYCQYKEDAMLAIEYNEMEFKDYEYAIIEQVPQGMAAASLNTGFKQLYKYNKEDDKFEKCDIPKCIDKVCFCFEWDKLKSE